MLRGAKAEVLELAELVPVDALASPAKPKKKSAKSKAEELFALQLLAYPSLKVIAQHRFAKSIKRRWRFDFAFPKYRLAVELDGVVMKQIAGRWYTMGRHADVTGMRGDNQKGAAAIMYGWSVLHFLQDDVKPRRAINTLLRVLAIRGWRA